MNYPPMFVCAQRLGMTSVNRMGVALLVALAAILVILTAVGLSLRAVASVQRTQVMQGVHDQQLDLLQAAENMAIQKIQALGSELVLPLKGGPIVVTADYLYQANADAQVVVWLYDDLAVMPYASFKADASLKAYLPIRWQSVAWDVPVAGSTIKATPTLDNVVIPAGLTRFPAPATPTMSVWSSTRQPTPPGFPRTNNATDANTPALTQLSLVEVFSTANQGRINRNTAPEWLLRAVYEVQKRDGIADAIRQRERGEFNPQDDNEAQGPLRLVATSDRWCALILVTVQGRERRWWIELVGNADGVQIVQRHDAAE